jgi:hypothetical protein
MAASPSTGTCFRTRRLKLNRRADDRCSATGSRPEYGSVDAQAAKSGDRALGDLPPALSWQPRSPSGSKSIRKNCVSWNRKAPCCARSSPLKAQKRRVLACPVLYRNGAPDTIRTCDVCLRSEAPPCQCPDGRRAGASRFRRGNCLPALCTPEQIDRRSIDNVGCIEPCFAARPMQLTAPTVGYKAGYLNF